MALRMQRRRTRQGPSHFSQSVRILCLVLASLLTSSAIISSAVAQAPAQNGHEVALARALFEEGIALADRGDWAAAADRFGRAHSLKPTAGIAFNWASALAETGQLTQASELLESVIRDPKAAPELKTESEKKLAQIAPRRAKLTLHVSPALPPDSEVLVDGRSFPRAAWDVALPVDPGRHEAVCRDAQQGELARAEVSLREGESKALTLAPAAPVAAPAPAPQKRVDQPAKKPLYKNWILWTGVGVALVAGAVAVAVVTTRNGDEIEAPIPGNSQPGVIRW
jgi:tetratricopeptide (TPR) repeat protein